MPRPWVDATKLSTGISFCKAPEVPTRIIVSGVSPGFTVRVLKSIFTSASSSFRTISILSVPIPVLCSVEAGTRAAIAAASQAKQHAALPPALDSVGLGPDLAKLLEQAKSE